MAVDRRTALLAYVLCAAVVLVLGWRWIAARERAGGPIAAGAPAVAAPPLLERAEGRPVVHVAGAVARPGVYRLRAGARVRDALTAAGGPRRGADTAGVNLAARVADGQQVIVPSRVPASVPGLRTGPLSLSSASVEQLDTLPGIGPATAEKIVAWRVERGGFSSVDQLAEIPGIGPRTLEALRAHVGP